jgi:hypothetical protein
MKKLFLISYFLFHAAAALLAEDIDGIVKTAVDGLASRLLYPLELSIGDINLAGTESPSAFSRYLSNRIMAHAPNNRMFKVVSPSRGVDRISPSGPKKSVIGGTFLREGDIVRVTLQLISKPDDTVLESRDFTISVAELERLGIAILPENVISPEEIIKREEIINPPAPPSAAQTFNLAAWPNSDTRTYIDGDRLKISIVSDQDCYFKVYHIDLNRNMQLIHPNAKNTDNRLVANVTRTIPDSDTISYILQAPFGQDTIKVVASQRQFENIAAEFNKTWTAAEETVRRAESYRGLAIEYAPEEPTVETVIASFNFTVLPANYNDSVYMYRKPENMTEAIQAMRTDILRQGGSFNERDGSFTMSGITGQYMVSGDTVILSLRYSGNQLTAPLTRGAASINFNIDRPRNISQAIQMVKSGIEAKGGVFFGNERQGNFRASGIAGQYNVADQINISITEKPAIIPASLIEKEVRKFFNGK